jgi:hypothetical protein
MAFAVDRFAAFAAHRLNTSEDATIRLLPGTLYAQLTGALAERYAETVLSHTAYAWRMDVLEAAERYMNALVDRGTWIVGAATVCIGHRVFLAMCRRGVSPLWGEAELVREPDVPDEPGAMVLPNQEFSAVRRRLGSLPQAISPGNAAMRVRQRHGSILLRLGTFSVGLPEEMSVWAGLTSGPGSLRKLPSGEPFNRFCGLLIDAFRTVHRPFQELARLGHSLCPFDWLDALSTNQVRALHRFLELIGGGDIGDPSAWRAAWTRAQVPGFASAATLWGSEIGHAMREPGGVTSLEIDSLEDERVSTEGILSRSEFVAHVRRLTLNGVLLEAEGDFLTRLYDGEALAELRKDPNLRALLRRRRLSFQRFISDLEWRCTQQSTLSRSTEHRDDDG